MTAVSLLPDEETKGEGLFTAAQLEAGPHEMMEFFKHQELEGLQQAEEEVAKAKTPSTLATSEQLTETMSEQSEETYGSRRCDQAALKKEKNRKAQQDIRDRNKKEK